MNGMDWMIRALKPGRPRRRPLAVLMAIACVMTIACQRRPTATAPDGSGAATTAPAPDELIEVSSPRAMDAEDDPEAPRALPRSSEVQGWIKTQAARFAKADRIDEFLRDPAAQHAAGSFHIQSIAGAEYTSPHATAHLVMVQGSTPQDALGIFSIAADGADCATRDDGSLHASRTQGQTSVLTAWQGTEFIRLECSAEQPAGLNDCRRLLSRTVFGLPAVEPPLLMRAVKDLPQANCRFWIARSAASLAAQPNPRLQQINPALLDARLGLDGSVLLSAVAVEQAPGAAPIIIWLAQYPEPEQARAAAERYARALETEPQGLDNVTFVGSPKGAFLMGTWTADQQAAGELVKMLEQVLPEP